MQALTLLLSDLWQIHNLCLFQSHVPASGHRSILCLSWPKLEGGCHEKPAINSQTNSGSLCTTYHLCVLYNALQDTVHAEWVEICQGLVNSEGKKKGGIVEKRKKALSLSGTLSFLWRWQHQYSGTALLLLPEVRQTSSSSSSWLRGLQTVKLNDISSQKLI